jgi:phenylacetate-CoA ligase
MEDTPTMTIETAARRSSAVMVHSLFWRARLAAISFALIPADLFLRFLAPRFKPYLWFMMYTPPVVIRWFGRVLTRRAVLHAAATVPAYNVFLRSHSSKPRASLSALPETDKSNYVRQYSTEDRCVHGRFLDRNTAIDESSGSTGQPYNWVRSMEERKTSHMSVSHFARYCLGDEPWITINAFSMGAWATGINMGLALQRNGVVKSTGPDMDKILHTLEFFGSSYRYLICGYPPFLKHFIDEGTRRGFAWNNYELNALVGGEGMTEGLRDYLYRRFKTVYSGYGATDLEIGLAGETPITVAIRRLARDNDRVRSELFGEDSRLPMLFQYNPLMHQISANAEGELVFTISRLNVLSPRIQYNIHDEGGVASFDDIRRRCAKLGVDFDELVKESNRPLVPLPFLWVYGRKDSTISVMGANIYPEDLEQSLYAEPELAEVTTSFCLSLADSGDAAVRPCFSFEVTAPITDELRERFRERIVKQLNAINLDFREAWREYPDALVPEIQLHMQGEGPFARDEGKIKQTRLLTQATVR